MSEEILKVGYYKIFEIKTKTKTTYRVDSGKTLYIAKFKKRITNPYRDLKDFETLMEAKTYAKTKLTKHKAKKTKIIKKLPKSLYLVLIKEDSSGNTFVKVGITSKRFIMRRFSKAYGYDGYTVETILRRIDTPDAEKLEKEIKDALNKKRSVKKYRPLLESFSGFTECFDYNGVEDIMNIFDELTKEA